MIPEELRPLYDQAANIGICIEGGVIHSNQFKIVVTLPNWDNLTVVERDIDLEANMRKCIDRAQELVGFYQKQGYGDGYNEMIKPFKEGKV